MTQLFGFICLFFAVFGCVLTTFVFCFWFVYLLDAIKSKWKFYRNALRCLSQEKSDSQQQMIVYNAKTEFVKNVFLFVMNFMEWLTLVFICILYIYEIAKNLHCHEGNGHNNITNSSHKSIQIPCIVTIISEYRTSFSSRICVSFPDHCALLSMVLVGSLCMYLASRYSQCSWLSSSKAACLISLLILYQVVYEIIASFCSLFILSKCFNLLIKTVSGLVILKQYRKLLMVINWSIVDMRVHGNNILLKRQIRMKQTFIRHSSLIWIGVIILLFYYCIELVLFISSILILSPQQFSLFTCEIPFLPTSEIYGIFTILNLVNKCVFMVGILLVYSQYVCLGLSTLAVVLWRLYTGKSAYRTHFHNELYAPLV